MQLSRRAVLWLSCLGRQLGHLLTSIGAFPASSGTANHAVGLGKSFANGKALFTDVAAHIAQPPARAGHAPQKILARIAEVGAVDERTEDVFVSSAFKGLPCNLNAGLGTPPTCVDATL
jgi:hypothetical protein